MSSKFWEYDPTVDKWTSKADFPSNPRYRTVGFAVGGYGYIGLGQDTLSYYKDFWQYNPSTDQWTKKADYPGLGSASLLGFILGDFIYAGCGADSTHVYSDFWQYNPSSDKWSRKTEFSGDSRCGTIGFSIGHCGYFGCGTGLNGDFNDFWEYTTSDSCGESFNFPNMIDPSNLTYNGSSTLIDSAVRLTTTDYNEAGSVYYNDPLIVTSGFTTNFTFRWSQGYNGFVDGSPAGADGLAFVVQAVSPATIGTNGAGIGYATIPNSLAVEFDTYRDEVECGDPDGTHVAVFTNGTLPNSSDHRTAACLGTASKVALKADSTVYHSKIEFSYSTNKLTIWLDTNGTFTAPVLEINSIDLAQLMSMIGRKKAFVGFTSSTGSSYENTDLLSWTFCAYPDLGILSSVDQPNNTSDIELSIFPNPVQDVLKINLKQNDNYSTTEIAIVNILGEQMLKQDFNPVGSMEAEIDISSLPTGCYVVLIKYGNSIVAKKIMKD